MEWRKEIEAKHLQSFEIFGLAIVGLVLVGLIMQNIVLFIAAGILLVHLLLHKLFENSVMGNLSLINPKRTIRLFPGEQSLWNIEMKNMSFFPVVNGRLRFNLGFNVKIDNNNEEKEMYWHGIEVPVSLMAKRNMVTEIPVTATQRGTARVSQLTYHFPHIFSFQPMVIRYHSYYQTEFIVYPELKEVGGLDAVFHLYPGEARMQYSPYEDIQSRIGTRDYQSSDSFQRINWKASVRSQQLQTNVYEKIADRSFVFIVNLKQEQRLGESERMESLLSYTAFLSKYSTEKDISYELLLNVAQPGHRTFLHQNEGKDNTHLAKTLELLARIPRQPIIHPFELLLFHTTQSIQQGKTVIIIGEISEESKIQITRLQHKGHTVFQLKESDGVAYIIPFINEKIA